MDPVTIAMLGGAAVKGLTSLFGKSPEELRNEQRRKAINAVMQSIARAREQAGKQKLQSDRTFSGRVTDRRGTLNSKLESRGFDPVGSIYSNEADLIQGNIDEKNTIENNLETSVNQMQAQIDAINAGQEDTPSDFNKFLSGGIEGANLGAGFADALGFLNPKVPGGTGDNTDKLLTETENPLQGMSDYGFQNDNMPTLETGDLMGWGNDPLGMLNKKYKVKNPLIFKRNLSLSSFN